MADNSIQSNEKILYETMNGYLVVEIPIELFTGNELFMMSADIKVPGNYTADETSMKIFELPPSSNSLQILDGNYLEFLFNTKWD